MGKRSDFERVERDFYRTIDHRAVIPILPFIGADNYAEPCCGEGDLISLLANHGKGCSYASDISRGIDALSLDVDSMLMPKQIITNPPWSRPILHQMIMHFKNIAPTWLLFDADWAHTKQAIPYLKYCTDIVSVGRLIWIEGTKTSGKDNCAWYRFDKELSGQIIFHPKTLLSHETNRQTIPQHQAGGKENQVYCG